MSLLDENYEAPLELAPDVDPARWPFCEMRARDEASRWATPSLGEGRRINMELRRWDLRHCKRPTEEEDPCAG